MSKLEGSGGARLITLMQKFGRNVDSTTHIAVVTSVDPFAIRIEGDPEDIEMDSLVIMQSILSHERKVDINGTEALLTFKEGYINPGDYVWVLETNEGQKYHVIDKVVV